MNNIIGTTIVLVALYLIIEFKFRPRIDVFKEEGYYNVVMWYSVKSKFDKNMILRDHIFLFKFKKNH